MEAIIGLSQMSTSAFLLVSGFFGLLGFMVGVIFHNRQSRVSTLIKEAKMRAVQVKELEKNNAELEKATSALSAKEFELTNANRRLRELENAKSKFVSVTAHQLRTPLAGLKWTFNLLQTGQLGAISTEQKEFVDKGLLSVQKMIKIVNDLLNVNLVEEGDPSIFHFESVDLKTLAEEVKAEFFSQAKSKNISLSIQTPTGFLPPVVADRGKIKMVLENLLDNAIKYTPADGQISVVIDDKKLNTAGASLEISVRDSGIGIVEADKPKIFQKFFRSAKAVSVEPDGSGLGLFIVRDIIERHGGSIWFDSEPGQGTSFFFTLPLRRK